MAPTTTQRLADLLLGQPVIEWVEAHRPPQVAEEDKTSYRMLARRLRELTDGQVDVAGETLRLWVVDAQTTEAAS